MIIEDLSTETLVNLHQMIREAQWADDAVTEGPKPFGVREHSDWRKQADQLEAQMSRRKVAFAPIDW